MMGMHPSHELSAIEEVLSDEDEDDNNKKLNDVDHEVSDQPYPALGSGPIAEESQNGQQFPPESAEHDTKDSHRSQQVDAQHSPDANTVGLAISEHEDGQVNQSGFFGYVQRNDEGHYANAHDTSDGDSYDPMDLAPLQDMVRSVPSSGGWEPEEQYEAKALEGLQREEEVVHTRKPVRSASLEELYKLTTEGWLDANEGSNGWYPINGRDDPEGDEVVHANQPTRPASLEELYRFTTEQWLDANGEEDGWYPINGSGRLSDPPASESRQDDSPVNFDLFHAVVNYVPPYFTTNYQGRQAGDRTGQPEATGGAVYSPNTRDWADYGSALVDYAPETAIPKVPGCTAGQHHAQNWTFGASAFIAYAAMRGSGMDTGNPLQTWMGVKGIERHGHDHDLDYDHNNSRATDSKADDFKFKQLRSFTAEVEVALWERPLVIDENRQQRVEIPRPKYKHLNPPEGFEYPHHLASSINGIAADSWERAKTFEEEYDISDDEGSPPSGRISPCTFRVLAEGCKRWEDPAKDHRVEMPPETKRLRPETPPPTDMPTYHRNRMGHKRTLQQDVEDGSWLSPIYSVTEDPSIIYTPPGTQRHPTNFAICNWQDNVHEVMDPLGAQHLREFQPTSHIAPKITTPNDLAPARIASAHTAATRSSENRPYTAAEVQAALLSPQARPLVDGSIAPEHAAAVLGAHWQWACQMRDAAAQQSQRNEEARQRINSLRDELRDMELCVDHVLQRREEEEEEVVEEEDQRRVERRNRRIIRQVSAHLREVAYEVHRRREQLCVVLGEAAQLECEEQVLTADVRAEIARSGLPDADAVRAEAGREFLELAGTT
ncbi:hypothetical protein SODALDRAFT_392700 [Sodiomyces alkalinus F11]|uniref:Uncharacterized protein n=1 Tax=Sodiomyces alkalinus (strain CBS 110278 / VKM F-3762 / F11) TaxID=1314773 RepID=A0A3N2Q9F8_SODAK|nr:hypothetical protein SODALDRAFT_392700 [Sodiomyces alkalinus F11]ROT43275.1 hypothetical protein SODALDRAFT_392700 [Sodiomyces alkalinus F11]